MRYIGVKEAAAKWNISDRRVRIMCTEGRIEGAVKLEWSWAIPENTEKPTDGRATRHMKNRYLRLGNIDLEVIDEKKAQSPLESAFFSTPYFGNLVMNNLEYSLAREGVKFSRAGTRDVLDGKVSKALSLDELLIVSNYKAVFRKSGNLMGEFLDAGFKTLLSSFFQGTGYEAEYDVSEEDKALQMEVLFNQYETEWKHLHPVFKAVLVFAEITRIRPVKRFNDAIATLAMNGILMLNGYCPVMFEQSMIDEINATLTLIKRRGNYQDFSLIVERCLLESYKEIEYV
jgi:hypothetical protein